MARKKPPHRLSDWRERSKLWEGRAAGPYVVFRNEETGAWEVSTLQDTVAEAETEEAALEEMHRLAAEWRLTDTERVYFIGTENEMGANVKIGTTAGNPEDRLRALQLHSPVRLKILAVIAGNRNVEQAYHAEFHAQRQWGEWFEITPPLKALIEGLSTPPISGVGCYGFSR